MTSNDAGLRVAIEAQLTPGVEGGLEPYLRVLAAGLQQSSSEDWAYTFVTRPDRSRWLADALGGDVRCVSRAPEDVSRIERIKRVLGPIRQPAGRVLRRTLRLAGRPAEERRQPAVVVSDGFYERLGVDVVHFPYVAHYEQTALPSVLTVHDLQHRHHPEFFSDAQMTWREAAYPAAMQHATTVVVDSDWVKSDIVRQYDVPPDKIEVAPLASPLALHDRPGLDACARVRRTLDLPERFALYPALTYGHKNHIRLIEAVARLRRRGIEIVVVCPGRQALYWPEVRRAVSRYGMEDAVRFPGFIPTDDLLALYRLAQFVVFPSLFEGAGLPVIEAQEQGVPVTCSDIPPLREYAGDAAWYFDPTRVDAIEDALWRLFTDDELRTRLREAGRRQAERFTVARMAERHQALYRQATHTADPVTAEAGGRVARGAHL